MKLFQLPCKFCPSPAVLLCKSMPQPVVQVKTERMCCIYILKLNGAKQQFMLRRNLLQELTYIHWLVFQFQLCNQIFVPSDPGNLKPRISLPTTTIYIYIFSLLTNTWVHTHMLIVFHWYWCSHSPIFWQNKRAWYPFSSCCSISVVTMNDSGLPSNRHSFWGSRTRDM